MSNNKEKGLHRKVPAWLLLIILTIAVLFYFSKDYRYFNRQKQGVVSITVYDSNKLMRDYIEAKYKLQTQRKDNGQPPVISKKDDDQLLKTMRQNSLIAKIDNPAEIKTFLNNLNLKLFNFSFSFCACYGDIEITFFYKDKEPFIFMLAHGKELKLHGGYSDTPLTEEARKWVHKKGYINSVYDEE